MAGVAQILTLVRMLGTISWLTAMVFCFTVSVIQAHAEQKNDEGSCAYSAPCGYSWLPIPGDTKLNCDLNNVRQTSTNAILDPCERWFREYSLFPLRFEVLKDALNNVFGTEKVVSQYAQSKCYRKFPATAPSAYNTTNTALLKTATFNPALCLFLQTTFWYRLSATPVIGGNVDNRFFLELMADYTKGGSNVIPTRQIWGSVADYRSFSPSDMNVWKKAVAEYTVDRAMPFTLSFFAHHGNNCQSNETSIDLDTIHTEMAQPFSCPHTTTTETPTEPCASPIPTVATDQPDTSDAAVVVFDGDNTYRCRTELRGLHLWLLEKTGTPPSLERLAEPTKVICKRGKLEFSERDPDGAQSTSLTFRAASLDLKCRTLFAQFLGRIASMKNVE